MRTPDQLPDHTHPLRRLWQYEPVRSGTVKIATLYSVLNKLFDLAPPVLIGAAVDIVVRRGDSWLSTCGIENPTWQLAILAGTTGLIWGLESVFEYLYRIRWRRLAQAVQHALRMDAYDHVQHLDVCYFENQSSGRLMSILNDDINQLERFLDEGASDLIQLFTTIVVIGGLFVSVAPSIGWMTILPMPLIALGSVWFQRKLAPLYALVREQVSLMNSHLANNLGGIATVKSFTAEPRELARIEAASHEYQRRNQDAIAWSSAFVPVIRMIVVTGFVAILFYGGQLTLRGDLSVAAYSILVYMTQRLLWPLTRLGSTLDLCQRAMASTNRVLDLLKTPIGVSSGNEPMPLPQVCGDVEFDNVTFSYALPPEQATTDTATSGQTSHAPVVLANLSFCVPAGQTAAIVGATGSGKSTIVKLLLRFYDVVDGRIRIDGRDVRDVRMADLRRAIGFVSQDVFLFHGTVLENIRYGRPEATLDDVYQAARAAEAHDFILALSEGYETVVGERGQKLSGGQRQRISIARAVLKDPPILVLDEATSAVDNETEAAIQRSLARISVGRTTIVIAHRLSTIRYADQILVLRQGQLCEQGQHDDLLALRGVYASLWRVQTGSREQA